MKLGVCCFLLLLALFSTPAASQIFPEELSGEPYALYFQSTGPNACTNPAAVLRAAATQGNANAQFKLGRIYDLGIGVPVDKVEARSWYRKAAKSGHTEAQYRLGIAYYLALGMPQDVTRAREYFEAAAQAFHPGAFFWLSSIYHRGQGVKKSTTISDQYRSLHYAASKLISLAGDPRYYDPISLLDEEIAKRDAEKGDAKAKRKLTIMHAGPKERFRAWRHEAEAGDPYAMIQVGRYLDGDDPAAKNLAATWYRRAVSVYQQRAQCDDADAQQHLGFIYWYGKIAPENERLAIKWFRRAADRGHAEATYDLATLIERDQKEEAVRLFMKAAKLGYRLAFEKLDYLYEKGNGVTKDPAKAYAWFKLSLYYEVDTTQKDLDEITEDARKKLSPEQFKKAEAMVKQWLDSAPR